MKEKVNRPGIFRYKFMYVLIVISYLIYGYAIVVNHNVLGDIFSPILLGFLTYYLYHGLVKYQNIKKRLLFGYVLTGAVFVWFFCDLWWAVLTLIFHSDPNLNPITTNGYSITNVLVFITIILGASSDLKRMNKVQVLLDTVMVFLFMWFLLWLFIFNESLARIEVLKADPVAAISFVLDMLVYAWINIWAFSLRYIKPPFYHRVVVLGGLVFVVTDFMYYYFYFFEYYTSNSWIDGAYMVGFSLMALGVYGKSKEQSEITYKEVRTNSFTKLGFELLILIVPALVFIARPQSVSFVINMIVILLIYYVLIQHTQKAIFQTRLLEIEKNNVAELEQKVKERTQEVVHILNTDVVTGLYNRRYFELKLQDTVVNRKEEEKIAILYIDQNKSSAVKYLYGQDTAEKLLQQLGQKFKIVCETFSGFIASHGDDTFIAMLVGADAEQLAKEVASQLINECEQLFLIDNHAIRVTVNIGISCYPIDTKDHNQLLRNADFSMIQARKKGFNHIQFYNENIGEANFTRHFLELKLKKVNYEHEFQLFFQPQVYCDTGELCGFEALIRWINKEGKMISPVDFIPIAEESGVIVPLGYWILEQAALQQSLWKKKCGCAFRIAVNISVKQLIEVDFVKNLVAILDKYEVKPNTFEIEITESKDIEGSMNILDTLNEIRALNVMIAIDDFGTGYSSLYYIKHIPTSRIKIAKELIDHIEHDLYSQSIVQMVIAVAKVQEIKVIAEGVETKEQWECLKQLGCDEIQGYYFSKPMAVKGIEENYCMNKN